MVDLLEFLVEGMSMNTKATLAAVREWPVADRLDLVFDLWDQILEDGWQPDPDEELLAELDRRVAMHEADPTNTCTWEQVLDYVRNSK
jgi:putative addiction module component (TIGR02574 family)